VAPAGQRPGRRHALLVQSPSNSSGRVARLCWLLLLLVASLALAVDWTPVAVPAWVPTAGAVGVTTSYAYGLAARTGGRPLICGALALGLALAATLSREPVLLAGIAVSTAVLGAVLGVMATKPAARYLGVIVECAVALAVAVVAAFAVEAYRAPVSVQRAGYLVLGLSLLGATGLVYRLGAGLHGLGRRGTLMVVSGIALLFVSVAYSEALGRWGTPGLLHTVEQSTSDLRATIGAVPRPTEALLGIPALAWGISTRARRRQGWWVCAFGAAGLGVVTVTLLNPLLSLDEAGLALLYSSAVGLVLGFALIRLDAFLTGTRGSRARRIEGAAAHRPEPGRMQALL
jgi:hypothetical protein